mgnify:FL=1
MEARSIPAALAPTAEGSRARTGAAAIPWPLAATVFAATSIIVGLIWDISWHISIGRDTSWTPAHMGIYLGGTLAGFANGFLVLKTTFRGTPAERAESVRFWGFRGPLGAFVSIWGAGAMLTSAPFDDWWHNAYGLDVEILSPPHTVLLLGILFVIGGACITALKAQNAAEAEGSGRAGTYRAIFAYAMGLLVTMGALAIWSDTRPYIGRSAHFYLYAAVPFPLMLAAAARGLRMRWPATTVALIYMLVFAGMGWILQPWPATPKLGPIRQEITHMVTLSFPLLLAVPAFAMDLAARAVAKRGATLQALAMGLAFFAVLVGVHWWFNAFMLSPLSHNPFFMGDHYPYEASPQSSWVRGEFLRLERTTADVVRGFGIAALVAVVSTRIGVAWGNWMRTVRR